MRHCHDNCIPAGLEHRAACPGRAVRSLARNCRSLGAALCALIALVAGAACDGRTIYALPDGSANSNYNGNWNSNSNTGECGQASDCVMALHSDACCACPVAASRADLAADPCLVPLGETAPGECAVECAAMLCPWCVSDHYTADCQAGECVTREGRCTEDTECVAAIRVDNCCQAAFPATRADIAADPCLMQWSGWSYWGGIPQECMDRWDPICDMIDCDSEPPWSRAAACSPDGCVFVPECTQPGDCTLMIDHRDCCACPTAWPASMQGHDPCLVPMGGSPGPGRIQPDCDNVRCEPCGVPAGALCEQQTCVDDRLYRGRGR